ncbi:hypothetical protein ACXX83_21695 [Pseudomonas sp. GNP012]
MSQSLRGKISKKRGAGFLKAASGVFKGGGLVRLEKRLLRKKMAGHGSYYIKVASARDEKEVEGAVATIGGKSLDDLKAKYRAFSRAG